MGASKKARQIRTAADFAVDELLHVLNPPNRNTDAVWTWDLAQIQAARDDQLRGKFDRPAKMAKAFATDSALFVARRNRCAPIRTLSVEHTATTSRGTTAAKEANALFGNDGVGIRKGTHSDINICLADHGIAFGMNILLPRSDGSRVDFEHIYWPIDWVRWDAILGCYVTRVDTVPDDMSVDGLSNEVPIVHGDGRWTIYSDHDHEPHAKDACLLAAALVWARHGLAQRDWNVASFAHSNVKILGKMPAGVSLVTQSGQFSAQALAYTKMLAAMIETGSKWGLAPAESDTVVLSNQSTAHQIWADIVNNSERSAARIYCGTDGFLGSPGGAPGVDLTQLFGVDSKVAGGDLRIIERDFRSGVLVPWTAINFGDSSIAPVRKYLVPDPDEQAKRLSYHERVKAFNEAIKLYRESGFVLTPTFILSLAARYDVEAPEMAPETSQPPPIPAANDHASDIIDG